MIRAAYRRTRPGFTLVELMVAAAVCVLIMAVLATAFQMGIDTMRQMKSTGEMMGQLRGATTALQADLKATHLLDANGQPARLSSLTADKVTVTDNGMGVTPRYVVNGWDDRAVPKNGFVRICTGTKTQSITYPVDASNNPKVDADGLNLASGIATNHYLHFTSILTANSDEEPYRTAVPQNGKTYYSTAAEIAYFLEPMGSVPGGPTLYRLIRRQRLAALSDTDRRDRPWPTTADEAVISLRRPDSKTTYISTLAELTNPSNRLGGTKWPSSTSQVGPGYAFKTTPADDEIAPLLSRPGEDIVLSNVISFEVQVSWVSSNDKNLSPYNTNPSQFDPSTYKTDAPFDILPVVDAKWTNASGLPDTRTYDSWSLDTALDWKTNFDPAIADAKRPPLLIRVQAVQVRIRVWEPKLQNARQVTIVQEL